MRWHLNVNITLFFYIRGYLAGVVGVVVMMTATAATTTTTTTTPLDDDGASSYLSPP